MLESFCELNPIYMRNKTLVAVGLMLLGMILIPVGDSLAKIVLNSTPYSPMLVAWVRFLIGGVVVLPFALSMTTFNWKDATFLKMQLLRAVLIVLTVVTIIKAVGMSPLADVFGAFFVGPILSVVLSSLLLKEKATWLEWASVAVGFIGVLLVVQPGFLVGKLAIFSVLNEAQTSAEFINRDPNSAEYLGVYWALLAGMFYGAFLTATRWAAASGPPLVQVAVQFLLAAVLLTPFGLYDLTLYGVQMPYLLLANGVSSVVANLLSIMALARARPATLAPVVYMQVVSATLIGLLIFKDSISFLATLGISVIVFSGLLRFDFQSVLKRRL